MNVDLKLIILHIDLITLANGVLLEDEKIISRSLENNNIAKGLRDILLEYLELQPDWVKFNLIDTVPVNSHIAIIYSCLIPSMIKNKKGIWKAVGEINDKETKRLIFQASQKV